mgnify:FL=1
MVIRDLADEIRDFAASHPEGWTHEEWREFIQGLSEAGHDVQDPDRIGLELEKERLAQTLRGMEIRGLGPRRIESITNRFGSLWVARNASSEDLADVPRLPRSLAARLTEELRSL